MTGIAFEILDAEATIERLHASERLRNRHEIDEQRIIDVVIRRLVVNCRSTLYVTFFPNLGLGPSDRRDDTGRGGAGNTAPKRSPVNCQASRTNRRFIHLLAHARLLELLGVIGGRVAI